MEDSKTHLSGILLRLSHKARTGSIRETETEVFGLHSEFKDHLG